MFLSNSIHALRYRIFSSKKYFEYTYYNFKSQLPTQRFQFAIMESRDSRKLLHNTAKSLYMTTYRWPADIP